MPSAMLEVPPALVGLCGCGSRSHPLAEGQAPEAAPSPLPPPQQNQVMEHAIASIKHRTTKKHHATSNGTIMASMIHGLTCSGRPVWVWGQWGQGPPPG
jgi:hypothetical protein